MISNSLLKRKKLIIIEKDRLLDVIALILVLLFGAFFFLCAKSHGFFGDCAVHIWISKEIWKQGRIISHLNFVTDANGTRMLICYPLLFHTALALSNILSSTSQVSFYIFIVFYSIFLSLSFYILIRFIFGRVIGLISLFILLCSPQIFTLSTLVFMETFLFAFILLGLFYLFKFLKFHSPTYLYLSSLFLGASIITKQSSLVILPPLVLWLILIKRDNVKKIINLRIVFTTLFILFIIIMPFAYYLISTTGTITYPPQGFVDKLIFENIFHMYPKWNTDQVSINYILNSMKQKNLINWLVESNKRIYRLFYPFDLNINLNIFSGVFFILLFLGILSLIKKNRDFLVFFSF